MEASIANHRKFRNFIAYRLNFLWRINLQSRKLQDVTKSSSLTVSQCHVLFAQVASLGHLEPLLHEALRQGPELFCSDYLHSRHALGESMKQIWVCEILARQIWYRISESNRYKLQQLPRGKLYGLTIQLEQLSKGSESDDAFGCLFWSPGPSKGSIKSCWKLKCHGFQVWTMDGTKPCLARAIYIYIYWSSTIYHRIFNLFTTEHTLNNTTIPNSSQRV